MEPLRTIGRGVGGGPMTGSSGQVLLGTVRALTLHPCSLGQYHSQPPREMFTDPLPSKYKCSHQVTGDQTPLTCTSSASLHLHRGYRWILPLSPLGANSTVFTTDIKAPCPPPSEIRGTIFHVTE